jgi:hypothetical protein
MNNREFREVLVENNWLSAMRADHPHPVSIDELQCQHCSQETETLVYDHQFSTRIACCGCGRVDEIDFRAFNEHTWTREDRDQHLSTALHTPTLDRRVDDTDPV